MSLNTRAALSKRQRDEGAESYSPSEQNAANNSDSSDS
jgi:hypothetical protein